MFYYFNEILLIAFALFKLIMILIIIKYYLHYEQINESIQAHLIRYRLIGLLCVSRRGGMFLSAFYSNS